MRHLWVLLLACSACTKPDTGARPVVPAEGAPRPSLTTVGPFQLSNQTSVPLTVVGEHLGPGLTLTLGAPVNRELPLTVVDQRHAFARLPGHLPLDGPETLVSASLDGGVGQRSLRLINDTAFPELVAFALSPDGARAFTVSTTEDVVYALALDGGAGPGQVTRVPVGDGPTAIAAWTDGAGHPWMVVAHEFVPELRLIDAARPDAPQQVLPAPSSASNVVVAGALALVAEHARDSVTAVDLAHGGRELWRAPVAPNPRAMAALKDSVAVGSMQTGELELLDLGSGRPLASLQPGPGTPIAGGGTAAFSPYVMNGSAPRALAWSGRLGRLFVASIGPNVGPNPQKLEVSMNGGVAEVDPARALTLARAETAPARLDSARRERSPRFTPSNSPSAPFTPSGVERPPFTPSRVEGAGSRAWLRHVGFGAGVTHALALDDARGLLYAADVSLGLVRVLDAARLTLLQELALPPPDGFPLVRPPEDFNVKGRAGPSLHSGPIALSLSRDGATLYALDRFTGTLALVDVRQARQGKAVWRGQLPITGVLAQRARRLGQVLYFADLGRTAMSCDACHVEGHTGGLLFAKTQPMRLYRSTTVRGSRDTPPYFTPASTFSMGETAKVVGGRNRFHNPDPSPDEIDALTAYSSFLTVPPNPFVGPDGAPVETLTLPDGRQGHPRRGLALFEGRAGCAACHPAPLYTLDQDPATRGRFLDVGTPHVMPLREAMQHPHFEGFGTPALAGAWDVFPMLTTGLAGLEVRGDGSLGVSTRFPLRVAVERWAPTHGRADQLSAEERDDLLAFVLSL